MTIYRSDYAASILSGLGVANTPQANQNLTSWMQAEGGSAQFNPLNTTLNVQAAGESNYNSLGVQNYPNYQTGTYATVQTLQEPQYANIVNNLNSPPAQFDAAVNSSNWGTHDLTPGVQLINAPVSSSASGIQTSTGAPASAGGGFVWYEPWTWASSAGNYVERGAAIVLGAIFVFMGVKMLFGDSAGQAAKEVTEVVPRGTKDAAEVGEVAA